MCISTFKQLVETPYKESSLYSILVYSQFSFYNETIYQTKRFQSIHLHIEHSVEATTIVHVKPNICGYFHNLSLRITSKKKHLDLLLR